MKRQKPDSADMWWAAFRYGMAHAFGLQRRWHSNHLSSDQTSDSDWTTVGETLANAMNEYGAAILAANPDATLPPRAAPLARSLPSPDILAHYERMWPGSADHILTMAEGRLQQRHVGMAVERDVGLTASEQGFLCGTAIVVITLVISFWLVSIGHEIPGLVGVLLVLAVAYQQLRNATGIRSPFTRV